MSYLFTSPYGLHINIRQVFGKAIKEILRTLEKLYVIVVECWESVHTLSHDDIKILIIIKDSI